VTFAERLRTLMAERQVSGRQLARLVPCDPSLVCHFRTGRKLPSEKMAKLFDIALNANGELAGAARAEALPGRRSVLAGGLLAGGLLAVAPDAREMLAWAERHPPQIDGAVVDSLDQLLTAQRHADDVLGSGVMVQPALAQLAAVENLVRQARGPVRPALLNVAEGWAQFGGWLCRNTAHYAGADLRFNHALQWAEELGDRTMIATVLANKSVLAKYQRQYGASIGLAQAAQRDKRAAAGIRALAAEYESRGHALAGDAAAAERKAGQAQELAAAGAPDQRPWLRWLTPTAYRYESGITCTFLAADPRWHARAVALLAEEETAPGVWASAQNLTYLASAHVRAGDVDRACVTALSAAAVVRRSGSARCAAMLARIHADLQARYPDDARVRELAGALA
jgi:hypothetical protein